MEENWKPEITDELSPNIVAQFIEYKLNVPYDVALNSEYLGSNAPCWGDAIRKYWINSR